jgi:hypothetical protein
MSFAVCSRLRASNSVDQARRQASSPSIACLSKSSILSGPRERNRRVPSAGMVSGGSVAKLKRVLPFRSGCRRERQLESWPRASPRIAITGCLSSRDRFVSECAQRARRNRNKAPIIHPSIRHHNAYLFIPRSGCNSARSTAVWNAAAASLAERPDQDHKSRNASVRPPLVAHGPAPLTAAIIVFRAHSYRLKS